MGVHGLWQLLQPAGQTVPLESLEGKVLAVDVSIWLHQTMKGMRDKDGNPIPNAHLQGLFSRVCKLLFYRIKPVFVFDGGVPALKKQTLAARRERKEEAQKESNDISEKLLKNLMKSQAVKQILGGVTEVPRRVPGIRRTRNNQEQDMFQLQSLPEELETGLSKNAVEWERDFAQQENWIKEGLAAISDVHTESDQFKSLPLEIQHEVLAEIKERRKYHSLSRITKMPEDSDEFSSYQLKKLMKQGKLTNRIESIKKDMSNKTSEDITYSLGDDYYGDDVEARRIVSEDASHYVLIKGMTKRKQIEQAEKYEIERKVKKEEESEEEWETDKKLKKVTGNVNIKVTQGEEFKSAETDSDDSEKEILATIKATRGKKKRKVRSLRSSSNQSVPSINTRQSARPVSQSTTSKIPNNQAGSKGFNQSNNIVLTSDEESMKMGVSPQVMSPVAEMDSTNSSSEDEGFIEVTVDPTAPVEEDELFPASVFETGGLLQNLEAGPTQTTEKTKANVNTRTREAERSKTKGGKVSETTVGNSGKGKALDSSRDISNVKPEPQDDVVVVSSFHKEAEKRKNVLSDILSQLQEKKKKLNDLKEDFGEMDVSSSPMHASSPEMRSTQSPGDIVPEDFYDESDDSESKEENHCGSEDEDLKRAIELSLKTVKKEKEDGKTVTENDDSLQFESLKDQCIKTTIGSEVDNNLSDSEDEDLKKAIALSLKTANDEKQVVKTRTNKDESKKLRSEVPEINETSGAQDNDRITAVEKGQMNMEDGKQSDEDDSDEDDEFELVEPSTPPSQASATEQNLLRKGIAEEETKENESESKEDDFTANQLSSDRTTHSSDQATGSAQVSTGAEEPTAQAKLGDERPQPEDIETDHFFDTGITEADLEYLNSDLDSERLALMLEQGKQNRMAASLSEQINLEAQDLLRLFGIPFIVSPMEAEAQCAYLDLTGQTQGTITDDSDFWLFGGQRLYKNFFNQNKHVEFYSFENIFRHFSLSREQLIHIALLCGSDYTEGISGVGPVRALEILAEFPGQGLDGLREFRSWWEKRQKNPNAPLENKLRGRFQQLHVISGFPSERVVDAYLSPEVDQSDDRFTWGEPDLDLLREFAKQKFGWPKARSDQSLLPMMKQLAQRQSQGRIHNYFQPEHFVVAPKIKSARLIKALNLVKDPQGRTSDIEGVKETAKNVKGRKGQGAGKKRSKIPEEKEEEEEEEEEEWEEEEKSDNEIEIVKNLKGRKAKSMEEQGAGKKRTKSQAEEEKEVEEEDDTSDNNEVERLKPMRKKGKVVKETEMSENECKWGDSRPWGKEGKDGEEKMAPKTNKNLPKSSTKSSKKTTKKGGQKKSKTCNEGLAILKEEENASQISDGKLTKGQGDVEMGQFSSVGDDGADFMQAMAAKVQKAKSVLDNKKQEAKRGAKSKRGGMGRAVPLSLDVKTRSRKAKSLTTVMRPGLHNLSESSSSSDSGSSEDEARAPISKAKATKLGPIDVNPTPGLTNTVSKKNVENTDKARNSSSTHNAAQDLVKRRTEIKVKSKEESTSSSDTAVSKAQRNDVNSEEVVESDRKLEKVGKDGRKSAVPQTTSANREASKQIVIVKEASKEKGKEKSPATMKAKTDVEKSKSKPNLVSKTFNQSSDNDNFEEPTLGSDQQATSEEENAEIDMSKADVSVINRQNLPATLAYLNKRSREEKYLLTQLRGDTKYQNALMNRIEEMEKRPSLEKILPKKKVNDNEGSSVFKPKQGQSFEDILGSLDTIDTTSLKSSKSKKAAKKEENIGKKGTEASTVDDKHSQNIGSGKVLNKSTLKSGNISSKKLNPVEMKRKKDDVFDEDVRSKDKSEKKVRFSEDADKDREKKYKKKEGSQTDSRKDNETVVKESEKKRNVQEGDATAREIKNPTFSGPKQTEPVLPSARSRAFDKPIPCGFGSDEDNFVSVGSKSKFEKQMEHLGETRIVKGHGFVPTQRAPARAFAGKGKGRGKNREDGERKAEDRKGGGGRGDEWEKGGKESFVTNIVASADVTLDEIMEYADMSIEDLGSDFSDME